MSEPHYSDLGKFATACFGVRTRIEWTDDRVARLRKLAARGLSAFQIALKIGEGATRKGVERKAKRIGAKLSGKPGRRPASHA